MVDDTGAPLPDLVVAVLGGGATLRGGAPFTAPGDAFGGSALALGEARTGADGRFVIEGLETRIHGALLVDVGGPRATWRVLESTPRSARVRDVGDVVLPRGVELTGRVVDRDARPVAGARVRLDTADLPVLDALDLGAYRAGDLLLFGDEVPLALPAELARLLPVPTAIADEAGRFALHAPERTRITLVADHPAHPVTTREVATGDGPAQALDPPFVLEPGRVARGRVVGAGGAPVAGVDVYVGTGGAAPSTLYRAAGATDAQGRFELPGLAAGPARALVRLPAAPGVVRSETFEPGVEEAVVRLDSAARLELTVTDAGGGPVPGLAIRGRPSDRQDELPDLLLAWRDLTPQARDQGGGRCAIDVGAGGHWVLELAAPGFAPRRVVVAARDGAATPGPASEECVVVLERARRLLVDVVRADDGAPVEWALVAVYEPGGRRRPLAATRTDAHGRATIELAPPGEVLVEVTHPGLAATGVRVPAATAAADAAGGGATIAADGGARGAAGEPVRVELLAPGAIDGVAFGPDGPAAGVLVVAGAVQASGVPLGSSMQSLAVTDAQGRFELEGLQPGFNCVELRPRIPADERVLRELFGDLPWAGLHVPVEAGQRVEVELAFGFDDESPMLRGRLFVNGAPGDGWSVTEDAAGMPRRAVVDAQGHWELGPLERAHATLAAHPPERLPSRWESTHAVQRTVTYDELFGGPIDWSITTGSVRGRVLSQAGDPLAGAAVRLLPHDAACAEQTTTSGTGGQFELRDVAAGRYDVVITAPGHAAFRRRDVDVPGAAPVEASLRAPLSLSGRVLVDGGSPGGVVVVQATADDGGGLVRASGDWFEFRSLFAGTWTFRLRVDDRTAYTTVTHTLSADERDVVLRFESADQPPPGAMLIGPGVPSIPQDVRAKLEALGYLDDRSER